MRASLPVTPRGPTTRVRPTSSLPARWLAAALALACGTHDHAARADAHGADVASPPLLVRVAKSQAERHREAVAERTRALTRLIRALPGVVDVTVALTRDDIASTPLDRPLAPAQVALVLHVRGRGPDEATLRALAQSVVRDLAADGLTVSRHPISETAPPQLVRVGPLEVSAKSATLLRVLVGLSLAGNVLLATLLLWRARPNRLRRPFVDRRGRGGPHA